LEDLANGLPIIAAGDIWDRWTQPPAVINFIIDNCPRMYAIPGQHDLASHAYENRERGAYGTLVRAGTLIDLLPDEWHQIGDRVYVQGFPWGSNTADAATDPRPGVIAIAAVHQYVHNGDHTCHRQATEEQSAANLKGLRGFHVCHFGDNHIPFEFRTRDNRLVVNTGGFYRRVADQQSHQPGAVVLYRDGNRVTYKRFTYDTAEEAFSRDHIVPVSYAEADAGVDQFIEAITDNDDATIDFRQYVKLYAQQEHVSPTVCDLLMKSVE
jgi:predicted phosphodiesterase